MKISSLNGQIIRVQIVANYCDGKCYFTVTSLFAKVGQKMFFQDYIFLCIKPWGSLLFLPGILEVENRLNL